MRDSYCGTILAATGQTMARLPNPAAFPWTHTRMKRWVGLGVIVDNFIHIGAALAKG